MSLKRKIIDVITGPGLDEIDHEARETLIANRAENEAVAEARREEVRKALGKVSTHNGVIAKRDSLEVHSGQVPAVKIEVIDYSNGAEEEIPINFDEKS